MNSAGVFTMKTVTLIQSKLKKIQYRLFIVQETVEVIYKSSLTADQGKVTHLEPSSTRNLSVGD
jgi:hypothetical protein